jgi:hypothetical protein
MAEPRHGCRVSSGVERTLLVAPRHPPNQVTNSENCEAVPEPGRPPYTRSWNSLPSSPSGRASSTTTIRMNASEVLNSSET